MNGFMGRSPAPFFNYFNKILTTAAFMGAGYEIHETPAGFNGARQVKILFN
jgi:hypothetical protein